MGTPRKDLAGQRFGSLLKNASKPVSPECAKIRADQMRKRNRQKKKEKENAENN